ncbi:UNVERIFIED_CONTAM: hypothetical protein Slati_3253400 [Sesamum latifolium]|uniref:Uncharacterized protein n=1 Tax=Sesamum latifolium TaxID=2727402 RepID=A0AAW2UXT7_9LAMI
MPKVRIRRKKEKKDVSFGVPDSPDYAIGTNLQHLIIQILTATTTIFRSTVSPAVAGKLRRCCFTVKASSSAVVDDDAIASLERCFQASPPAADAPSSTSSSSADFGPVMKGKYGAFGAVTLEKSKLDLTQKQTKSSPELSTGGGGGNIGKGLSHGGGDGGDDGGDDDDYFDDFDEGDEGDEGGPFRRRIILAELFDRKFVDAVLNEWQKTMMDLPAGFRQAYEMGLVSSAQMVKFLAINARPTTERFISRSLPQGLSRAFIGRMIADPAFLYRLLLEQATTIGCSVWWRSRIARRGAAQGAISNLAASKKEGRLSVTVPSVSSNALGYGAFLGLYANLRYQLLCGFDRAVTSYFDVIGVALFFSTALRVLNVQLGETSRLAWLGVEVDPLAQSDDLLKAAYNRPSEGANQSSSKWFISKNAVVSGLGLLGIRQGRTDSNTEGEAPPPKARRKRIVRRKVATS